MFLNRGMSSICNRGTAQIIHLESEIDLSRYQDDNRQIYLTTKMQTTVKEKEGERERKQT